MNMPSLLKIAFSVIVVTVLSLLATSCESLRSEAEAGRYETWSFDTSWPGSVPKGWKVAETAGAGKPAKWEVIHDSGAASGTKAVGITENENRGQTFNLLLAEKTAYKNLQIRVMVKALAGEEDQGGGPVWRAIDADNYYIARWNPLEDNFRVYFVKDGKREQIGSDDVTADHNTWHEITITHRDETIVASLDGKEMIEVSDSTFTEAGKIGLWVKADGRTAFDNVSVVRLSGFYPGR